MNQNPFFPVGPTALIAATTTSARITALPANATQVRVYNAGPNVARIAFGGALVTATVTDMIIPVGVIEVFCKQGCTGAAAICETGTASVYVVAGEGQ